jgi:hypothetical protein
MQPDIRAYTRFALRRRLSCENEPYHQYYVKHSFSKDAALELIERSAAEHDIVITAIGECGSCCSCCVRDPIALDRLGVPSAAMITTEFVRETKLTRTAVGMEGPVPVVIDHPVSSITQAEVEARVAQVQIQTQAVWTERAASAASPLRGEQNE